MDHDDRFDESLSKTIKSIVDDDCDSLDYFKDIKYIEPDLSKYQVKKKFHQRRYFALIASMLAILILSGTFALLITSGSVDASKFKIEQQLTLIGNHLTQSKEYTVDKDSISLKINKLTQISKAQKFFPGLFKPANVPARFHFESLEIIKKSDGLFQASYVYSAAGGASLSITQETIPDGSNYSVSVVGVSKEIKKGDGTIYISENPFGDGANAASYITETEVIDVGGTITVDEILDILD